VDGVSFRLQQGETLGLVGESGCGKTTVLMSLVRVVDPTAGAIQYRANGDRINVLQGDPQSLRRLRQQMRMVYQDPESSINPRFKIRDIVAEPLLAYGLVSSRDEAYARVRELMARVGLDQIYLNRYPYALSGGQRQRIGIARALATNPQIILADEPTSALDVSVQAQILNLLLQLQAEMGLTMLFVTHDLSVVRHVSDRIAVMYLGEIVEIGQTRAVFNTPRHPYTEALFSVIPQPDRKRKTKRILLSGDIPDPARRPSGCPFRTRCRYSQSLCATTPPSLEPVQDDSHLVSCHFPLTQGSLP
jgi:oligopeptide/dipeptide ABC transporter ATP-binding protein